MPRESEKRKIYKKKWREINIEKVKENAKKWADANPEKRREIMQKWRAANPEKAKESVKKWRDLNQTRIKERSRKYRGILYAPDQSEEMLLISQDYKCGICKRSFSNMPANSICVDHDHNIVDQPNVRGLLCRGCNIGIGNLKDSVELLQNAIIWLSR